MQINEAARSKGRSSEQRGEMAAISVSHRRAGCTRLGACAPASGHAGSTMTEKPWALRTPLRERAEDGGAEQHTAGLPSLL